MATFKYLLDFLMSKSSKAVLEEGLPQGSSLSCTLFFVFLNDVSDVLKIEIALFADDLVLWHTGNSIGGLPGEGI